jgi:hypothetical protein
VRDVERARELLDVALERELLVRLDVEERRVRRGERAEECGVRGVEREPERRQARVPAAQVAPVPADLRKEDASDPHAQDGRNVLESGARPARSPQAAAKKREELVDRRLVERRRGRNSAGASGA